MPSTIANSEILAISLIDLSISLLVAIGLGLFCAGIYRWTHRGLTYERTFLVTLVLMPAIVGLVMMLIGSNLALSLGLVGALSIIRFRTVIKDSRDMVFLFWGIAIGLGCGTFNWIAVGVSSLFIAAIILVLYYLEYGKQQHFDCVLVIDGDGDVPEEELSNSIDKFLVRKELRNLDIGSSGYELVLELRMQDTQFTSQKELIASVKSIDGVRKVSLLSPRLSLPV